jgi:diadenosine tetraphosphatase ApaH/serine/threonine PP2A family protein phosphatase
MMDLCVTYFGLILKVFHKFFKIIDSEIEEWENNPRGAGVIFGVKIVDKFLKTNAIDCIVRAHQLINDGYKLHWEGKLITIWSAPNYCYR